MQNHPRLAPFMPGGRLFAELCSESEPVNFYMLTCWITSWEKSPIQVITFLLRRVITYNEICRETKRVSTIAFLYY